MDKSTVHTKFVNGMPVLIPNETKQAKGFYISYNNYDVSIYGDVTTALVTEPENHFYILNGDHRKAYDNLIESGFSSCLEYFNQNISLINKYSENPN